MVMKMNRVLTMALCATSVLASVDVLAQEVTVPENIVAIEQENGKTWMVKNDKAPCWVFECIDVYQQQVTTPKGSVFSGVKIGDYVYDYDENGYDFVFVYKANDCTPVTLSNYIPLEYGGSEGVKMTNGFTMYIVPFNTGKYEIEGMEEDWQLEGTYAMILDNPDLKDTHVYSPEYRVAVNIKKTLKGYDLSDAYGVYAKEDMSTLNVVSKDGVLLKNAFAIKGGQECVCEPVWVVEYETLCDSGTPIGTLVK